MKFSLSQLWQPSGTIGRGPYLAAGLFLFGVKHNLDRCLATFVFGQPWGLFNYWVPAGALNIRHLPHDQIAFLGAMLILSLPFIWSGVCLTLARLRDTRLPLWLVFGFFLPFVNLLFFLLLSVLPGVTAGVLPMGKRASWLDRIVPNSPGGSAAAGIGITLVLGGIMTGLSVNFFKNYGWGLFVAIPFCMGMISVLVYGFHFPRTLGACITVSIESVALFGFGLIVLAYEGVICVLMAAPIALVLGLIGGVMGWAIQRMPESRLETPRVLSLMLFAVPVMMGVEKADQLEPPVFEVKTAIVIDAPPECVWKHVVSFTELPPPTEWAFRAGIAYPTRAEIRGFGAGAVRHCRFSTGCFVEPIEVWDEPRLLRFSVSSNPPPMREWTFYSDVHPPHLDGYLVSRRGQFLLTRLPDGRTHLEGTTWYQHGLWPTDYWRVWSDEIIHTIHTRVLRHIKKLSEEDEMAHHQS